MEKIANFFKTTTQAFEIVLKRQMRVLKADFYQFTLCEVYKINDLKVCGEMGSQMDKNKDLFDLFIRK